MAEIFPIGLTTPINQSINHESRFDNTAHVYLVVQFIIVVAFVGFQG